MYNTNTLVKIGSYLLYPQLMALHLKCFLVILFWWIVYYV